MSSNKNIYHNLEIGSIFEIKEAKYLLKKGFYFVVKKKEDKSTISKERVFFNKNIFEYNQNNLASETIAYIISQNVARIIKQ